MNIGARSRNDEIKVKVIMKIPKLLTEPIRLSTLSAGSRAVIVWLKQPRTINLSGTKGALRRPLPLKLFFSTLALLWLFWPGLKQLLIQDVPILSQLDPSQLLFVLNMISTVSVLILLVSTIRPNKMTVELGLVAPASPKVLDV
jgi:hypothetical protein